MGNNINLIEQVLKEHSVMILDGALATELEARGCDLKDPLWSARVLLEEPELIYEVHYDYFKAGADCAITASYQASIDGFLNRGITEKEAISLMKQSVELAKKARDDFWKREQPTERPKPLVVASAGPYGAYLADGSEYVGNYGVSDDLLASFHQPRIEAFIDAGADLLAFETIPSWQEANVLCELLKEFPNVWAWLSFSLKDAKHISDGTELAFCARKLNKEEQIASIGVNCVPATIVVDAIDILKKETNKPIVVYPNSGETYDAETNTWHGTTNCERFDYLANEWYKSGARLIGGCCRTSPKHIEAITKLWR